MFAWINVVLDIRCVQMCVSWTNPAGQNCKYMHTVVVRQLQKISSGGWAGRYNVAVDDIG